MIPEVEALKEVLNCLVTFQSKFNHSPLTEIARTHIGAAIIALEERKRLAGAKTVPKFPTQRGWYFVTLGDQSGILNVQFVRHHNLNDDENSGLKLLVEENDDEFQEDVNKELLLYYEGGELPEDLEFSLIHI